MNTGGLWLLAIAGVTVALDQYTKGLVRAYIPVNQSWNPIPWLEPIVTLTHVQNTGAAFGIFPNMNIVFIGVAIVVIALIAVFYRRLAGGSWMLRIAFGLQLAGALGNLIDRLTIGYVTDFVDVRIWPVFNVADSAIVVGTALLAYYAIWMDREDAPEADAARAADPSI